MTAAKRSAPREFSADPSRGLVTTLLGGARCRELVSLVAPVALPCPRAPELVSRTHLALALATVLFGDVMNSVPLGRAYASERAEAGRPLVFDHGGVRTVAAACGALPAGVRAITRVLEPLGYTRVGTYPLPALRMTGYAYAHRDEPESLPQYFVSELHPERFSPAFSAAVERVLASSVDPLAGLPTELLDQLASRGELPWADAVALLPELRAVFARQHADPSLEDYAMLLAESDEMAWIATEGQAFNHATDRVDDVDAVCAAQRALGRPVKAQVSISRNGRVRQSAFQASPVRRLFRTTAGHRVEREVPGSFWEFISRARLPGGQLDLTFDTGNATEIFAMTTAAMRAS